MDVSTSEITLDDYVLQEVDLGEPTREGSKTLATLGLKHALGFMNQDEERIKALVEKNEAMKRFILKIAGPIDLDNPEVSLQAILEKSGEINTDVPHSFVQACADWKLHFEQFPSLSFRMILRPFQSIFLGITSLMEITSEENGVEETILNKKRVLDELTIIRKQRFQVLVKIYEGLELDSFEEWIHEIAMALAVFEKVLKRLNKRRDDKMFLRKSCKSSLRVSTQIYSMKMMRRLCIRKMISLINSQGYFKG